MSIRIEIWDEGEGLLQQIALVSYEAGLQALSKSGAKIQKEARKSMESKTHHWVKEFINGKVKLEYKHNETKKLGYRISHRDGSEMNPKNMSSMITSYLMPKSGTVVIGGKHKRFRSMEFKNGEFSGYGETVPAVGKKTHAILHKLNTGEKNSEYKDGILKNPNPRPYKFMGEGFDRSRAYIARTMSNALVDLIGKKVNASKITVRKRVG